MTNEEIVADKIKEYEVFKKEAEERESKSLETIEAGLPRPQWILSICTQR